MASEADSGDRQREIHAVAVKGFDSETGAYESSRPSYPADAVAHLKTQLRLTPSQSHVLDLAAGSGKFTRLLESDLYHLTAVEPSPSMRATFAEILPAIPILDGTAYSIPLPSSSQDAVVVAQAFHWFAHLEAVREIHRVLKPGGRLGLIWNLEDRTARRWVGSLRDLYERYEKGTPQYRLGLWRQVWEMEESKKMFTELQEAHFEHEMLCSEEMVWGRVLSKSYIACLSNEEKALLRQKVLSIVGTAPDVERHPNGLVVYPYKTDLIWCEKILA